MLEVGQSPADFTLMDETDTAIQWKDLRGQPVVIFFYPKASTPGCTKEACAFTDLGGEFTASGIHVFGASADSVSRQKNFSEKYALSMSLLSDPEHTILKPWGVWGEKKNYGKTYMGIIRSTFLFDANGVLLECWKNIRVKGHADRVLQQAQTLLSETK